MNKRILTIFLSLLLAFTLIACKGPNQPNGLLTYDMSGVSFKDKTVYYDGSEYELLIEGSLPEGVTHSYENNGHSEIGVYTVTVSFVGDDKHHPIPQMTAKLTILDSEVVLPDLDKLSMPEIEHQLLQLGFSDIIFEEVFNVSSFKGRFVKYKNNRIGDFVSVEEPITILIATRALPDITTIYTEDIYDFFVNAGVSPSNIISVPQVTGDPEFGLGYIGYEAGDDYISGQIKYLVNTNQVKLKDLSGLSMYEVNQYLNKNGLTATFHYLLDNDYEYDSFSGYAGYNIGDIVNKGTELPIFLYENDDLDDELQLFMSKYVDITIGNNGLELYNATNEAINLEDYYISIFSDGAVSETYRVLLSGTLASKSKFFIASNTSAEEIKAKADLISSQLVFDGNDTIQLRKTSNNTYIDTIYNIGNTNFILEKEIFIRRDDITRGTRGFQMREWAGFIPTFTSPIGTHPYEIETFPPFEYIDDIFQDYGMTKVRYKSASDGDTVYFESLDPRDDANYDGDNRIRFLMVNTPETGKPGVEHQDYANTAANYTRNALSTASEIYIQADVAAGLRENYGRHLAYVWYNSGTVNNPSWHLLNHELIHIGYGQGQGIKDIAGEYLKSAVWGNRYVYQWTLDADTHAKSNELGIWSGAYQD